ncbi:MAG: phytoene desaturase family protein [Planctomycetia bacterium]|nr:phytoene desaturase family protein [Planctomycetia bacterium]
MTHTVNIIGAGPGGLACAMLLAHAGIRVRILERASVPGGRTSTISTPEGFHFDLGPTFFLYPRILEEIFTTCGYDLNREIEMIKLDPQYRLVFGNSGELLATPNTQRMEEAVTALSPADAGSFTRFMTYTREKFEKFAPVLEKPFESWFDLASPDLLRLLPLLSPWRSLDAELGRFFSDERIRLAFTFQSKYLGMSPFRCPSLFSILSFLEYEHGVYHPIGGCGAVSVAMARIAQQMGVEILYNEPVESIRFEGRRVAALRTSQAEYTADATVINADFARTMTRLIPDHLRRRWNNRSIESKRFSCSTFMLYLGLDGIYEHVPHHTIYLSEHYRENLADIEKHHRIGSDPSMYVQNACVTDPSLAPRGMSTLYILVPVTHRHPNVDWRREAPRFREIALDQLERVGIHDVRKKIRYERMLTPDDWEDQYEIYRGATFNLSHNLGQMLHKRPHNRFEELAGVYLVGGGTHPGSGLPVIYSSARITSKLLLKDLGVFQPENRSIDRKEWTQAPSTREASMACSTGLFQNSQLNPQE